MIDVSLVGASHLHEIVVDQDLPTGSCLRLYRLPTHAYSLSTSSCVAILQFSFEIWQIEHRRTLQSSDQDLPLLSYRTHSVGMD